MIGHVQGGWEYIWAAYFISWLGLALFAGSLFGAEPAQRAWRFALWGAMLAFAGVAVALFATPERAPFIDGTVLTVTPIGGGLVMLGYAAFALMQNAKAAKGS